MSNTRRYEGSTIEDVLVQIENELGPAATIVNAHKVRKGGVGGFFSKERCEVEVVIAPGACAAQALPAEPDGEHEPARTEPRPVADILDIVDDVSDAELVANGQAPPSRSFAALLADLVATTPAPVARIALEPEPEPVVAPGGARLAVRDPQLEPLGLPEWLRPPLVATDRRAALERELARLPDVPELPAARGAVVAVIGPRREAMDVAAQLTARYGAATADTVVIAPTPGRSGRGPRRLHRLPDVAAERRTWRRRRAPTVVVIEAGPGASRWVDDALGVLEPTLEWAVVDAARKVEDVAAWLDGFGGVDALAVHGTDTTVSPASVLRLRTPVGLLDGRDATPECWAALLADRLERADQGAALAGAR